MIWVFDLSEEAKRQLQRLPHAMQDQMARAIDTMRAAAAVNHLSFQWSISFQTPLLAPLG